jgi:hypothetical protein
MCVLKTGEVFQFAFFLVIQINVLVSEIWCKLQQILHLDLWFEYLVRTKIPKILYMIFFVYLYSDHDK